MNEKSLFGDDTEIDEFESAAAARSGIVGVTHDALIILTIALILTPTIVGVGIAWAVS